MNSDISSVPFRTTKIKIASIGWKTGRVVKVSRWQAHWLVVSASLLRSVKDDKVLSRPGATNAIDLIACHVRTRPNVTPSKLGHVFTPSLVRWGIQGVMSTSSYGLRKSDNLKCTNSRDRQSWIRDSLFMERIETTVRIDLLHILILQHNTIISNKIF